MSYGISRVKAIEPRTLLSWSSGSEIVEFGRIYRGNYVNDGVAYNRTAYNGESALCMLSAFKKAGFFLVKTSLLGLGFSKSWEDADGPPHIDRYMTGSGAGPYAVLTCPDLQGQLIIWLECYSTQKFLVLYSPSGSYPCTSESTPGTAADGVPLQDYYTSFPIMRQYVWSKGSNGEFPCGRVIGSAGTGVNMAIGFDCVLTDLSVAQLPKNGCCWTFMNGNGGAISKTAVGQVGRAWMSNGRAVSLCWYGLNGPGGYYTGKPLSDRIGEIDDMFRFDPIALCNCSETYHQFFGYLPDLYWADQVVLSLNDRIYDLDGFNKWASVAGAGINAVGTMTYVPNAGDGLIANLRTPGTVPSDATLPTFSGAASATAIDDNTIRLTWEEGTDDTTAQANLEYEIHVSTTPGASWRTRGKKVGP